MTCWLIAWNENGMPKAYLSNVAAVAGGWGESKLHAIRFLRAQDAEAAIALFDLPWLVRPGVEIKAVEDRMEG